MVLTDVFDKFSCNIANLILSQESYIDEDILLKVHKRYKTSEEDILNAVTDIDLTPIQKVRINSIQKHMDYVNYRIYLKPCLVEVTRTAVKDKGHPSTRQI